MPAPGWKSVSIEEDVHLQLTALSALLRRSVSWTASRVLEHVAQECFGGHAAEDPVKLDRVKAEKYDLI